MRFIVQYVVLILTSACLGACEVHYTYKEDGIPKCVQAECRKPHCQVA